MKTTMEKISGKFLQIHHWAQSNRANKAAGKWATLVEFWSIFPSFYINIDRDIVV